MDLFSAIIKPLVWQPERAFFIATIFLSLLVVAAIIRRDKTSFSLTPLLVATGSWLLFGIGELYARKHGWNIRVDLLLTGPLLIVITIVVTVLTVWRGIKSAGS